MKHLSDGSTVTVVTSMTWHDYANEIIKSTHQEDAFFVADLEDIILKFQEWKLKMPRVQPFYAVKCNDCPAVLQFLASLGIGFDCASKGEIECVLGLGVEPSHIVYANTCKSPSYIQYAASVGVDFMTFDNELELFKIKKLCPKARLLLRIKVDDSKAVMRLGTKFGCEFEDVKHLLTVGIELKLNIVGVSFHVGGFCYGIYAHKKAIATAKEVFDIATDMGYNMKILDIGGGFPGCEERGVSFEDMARDVNISLDEYFPADCNYKIIAEPGTYFVESAFTLYANIIGKREIRKGDEPDCMYFVNDGVYGSFHHTIFHNVQHIPVSFQAPEDGKLFKSSVWGPTCDGVDRIAETCFLPSLEISDWLTFRNMGAYTHCAFSNFNGFQKPKIKYIIPARTLRCLRKFQDGHMFEQRYLKNHIPKTALSVKSLTSYLIYFAYRVLRFFF